MGENSWSGFCCLVHTLDSSSMQLLVDNHNFPKLFQNVIAGFPFSYGHGYCLCCLEEVLCYIFSVPFVWHSNHRYLYLQELLPAKLVSYSVELLQKGESWPFRAFCHHGGFKAFGTEDRCKKQLLFLSNLPGQGCALHRSSIEL